MGAIKNNLVISFVLEFAIGKEEEAGSVWASDDCLSHIVALMWIVLDVFVYIWRDGDEDIDCIGMGTGKSIGRYKSNDWFTQSLCTIPTVSWLKNA